MISIFRVLVLLLFAIVAVVLAYRGKSLIVVALSSSAAVLLTEWMLQFI